MNGAHVVAQVTWQAPQLAPAAVGLSAVVFAAVLWLYPPQTRGVALPWRWTMPLLRALAAAAIALAIVQPIVLRPRTTARQGAVVLLVDRSRSMSVTDHNRSPADLIALAGGLGALPPGKRQEAAPALRQQLESVRSLADQLTRARTESDYAALSGRGVPAAAARVRDISERLRAALDETSVPTPLQNTDLTRRVATLKQVPPLLDDAALRALRINVDATARALAQAQAQLDESLFRQDGDIRAAGVRLAELSRADLVRQGLASESGARSGVLAQMSAMAPVFGFAFDQDVMPLPWSSATRGDADAIELSATGSRTDIAESLRAALQRMGTRAVQAIVLISDGRQVGADAEVLMGDVAGAGVPILAVSAAALRPQRDVSIASVSAPSSGRVQQTIPVRAQVRGSDFNGAPVVVRLDAGNVRQVREVTLNEQGEATVEFDVTLVDPGPQALILSATPFGNELQTSGSSEARKAPEATLENNRFVRYVRVGREPARVTVLAGRDAARQYASLHDALSRTPWVTLREVSEEDIPAVTPRSILAQDIVILLDVPQNGISRSQWQAIDQLVRQRGGSVIICAGQHVPAEYIDDPLVARLLPFGNTPLAGWRTWPGGEPHFRVAPPASTGDEPEEDLAPDAWRNLPALSRYVPVPPLGASARALLVERDTGAAVVTEAKRGLGKLYFIGTDQTWRWHGQSRRDARSARDQFWPRLIRLAAGEPLVAVQDGLQLDVDDVAPEPRQPVVVRARIRDPYGDPVDEPTQSLEIEKEGQVVREVALASLGDGSGRYRGVVNDLEAGNYLLRIDAPEDPSAEIPPDPVELRLRVAPRYEAELVDVSGDDRLLRRIADASGGQFLTLEQLNTLPARLDTIRQRQSRLVEYRLWDSPYLFVFVLACLSTEWALRKKFGLA